MTRYVGAAEAARRLGVQRATLYAYVSRGLIGRRVAVDGRTSLYSVDDLEALAGRAPDPRVGAAPVARRADRHRASPRSTRTASATAATTSPSWPARASFEQVAELLWTGALPPTGRRGRGPSRRRRRARWPGGPPGSCRGDGVPAIVAVANALGVRHPDDDPAGGRAASARPAPAGPRCAAARAGRRHRRPPGGRVLAAADADAALAAGRRTGADPARRPRAGDEHLGRAPRRLGRGRRLRRVRRRAGRHRRSAPRRSRRRGRRAAGRVRASRRRRRRRPAPARRRAPRRVRPQDLRRRRSPARSAARGRGSRCPIRAAAGRRRRRGAHVGRWVA